MWLDPPSPSTGSPSSNEFIPLLTIFLGKAEKFVDPVPDRCGGACGVIRPTKLTKFWKVGMTINFLQQLFFLE
jgi:hypothetical protein